MPGRTVLLAAVAIALAGCLAPAAEDVVQTATPAAETPPPALELEMTGCDEGGGHSTYNRPSLDGLLPEPWQPANVADQLGNPRIGSYLVPLGDDVTGIYHTTIVCEAWSLDGAAREGPLVWGFVGIPVEAPAFDDGTATRHYLLDVLSFGDADVRARLEALGLHVGAGEGAVGIDADAVLRTRLRDDGHGLYEAVVPVKEHGAMEPGPVRLWMVHGHDGVYAPTSLDLLNSGGTHWVAEGTGYFHHLDTKDHAPLPGANGNVAALAFTGFDRVVRLGPAPDVVLHEAWEH